MANFNEATEIIIKLKHNKPNLWREWLIRRRQAMSSGTIPEQIRDFLIEIGYKNGVAAFSDFYFLIEAQVDVEAAGLPINEQDRLWAIQNSNKSREANSEFDRMIMRLAPNQRHRNT